MSEVMPLIPIRGLTVFPNMVLHFDLGRGKSVQALERAMVMNQTIFISSQKDPDLDLPVATDVFEIGTVAKIKQMIKIPNNGLRVLVDGQYRARALNFIHEVPYFLVEVEKIEDRELPMNAEIMALKRTALAEFRSYIKKHNRSAEEPFAGFEEIEQPGRLADMMAANMGLKPEDAQSILAAKDPVERLKLVAEFLARENEIMSIEAEISSKLKSSLDKNYKQVYLREQIRVINQELGMDGKPESETEAEAWRAKLKELQLSELITKKIEKEIDRYSRMMPNTPDSSVVRTYVEWVLGLPWNDASDAEIDLIKAKSVLDKDHFGMEKLKDRILEYLAVRKLSNDNKAPILCLAGPPGVGKTSIAKSVARATGREFVHMSLGGVRDEAEIRGHRRTYLGAIPGRVMSAIKECEKNNPVFLIDEVDKICADIQGDPAAALLEVLDPEQNKEFMDRYLEVPFDLSNVLFIATANTTETIPRPLLDRMEVLELSGYTVKEKYNIARKYLVPKQRKAAGLCANNISFDKSALLDIINYYTRESGVRNLEKTIGSVCRKVARSTVEGDDSKKTIKASNLEEYLGEKKILHEKMLGKDEVGVVTGLAWTPFGGDTLFIETAVLPGSGQLQLTGQLGDVMQESAKTAISYIRAHAEELGIDKEFYKNYDIHIHVPEGATPKDGPSAGVTICTAVVSALTGRKARKNVAMTGEITLRGKILAVGGIKEKSLAAYRLGIKKVLLPEDCKSMIDEIPEETRAKMEFVLITNVSEALKEALI